MSANSSEAVRSGCSPVVSDRPVVSGKFISVGGKKLYIRGVTYGPFAPSAEGVEYRPAEVVEADFRAMRENGINVVRVYTVPPRWLLDLAQQHELRVLIG